MAKRYYITTPIYYVNDIPHVGTALTTIVADTAARVQRAMGREVFFLTGTDENAPKVAEAAHAADKTPQAFVNEMAEKFIHVWRELNIQYDQFIRTTDPYHKRTMQEVFKRLLQRGDIYKGDYEGWYCIPDETFFPPSKVKEDKLCPECHRPLEWRQEESYFFRLSAYSDRLREYIQQNPEFIQPETRRNEVLGFIADGLSDNAISRQDTEWGIPVPGETGTVIYVWFEALVNYLTATGWVEGGDTYLNTWPPDLQLMGKDILPRFHGTLWPAMLIALDLPLPKRLFAHGWWIFGGEKISKSKGNVVEPIDLIERWSRETGCEKRFAVDALRYYMLREMPTDQDAPFTIEGFEARYTADLANDLGNLVHRTLSMVNRYLNGTVPAASVEGTLAELIRRKGQEVADAYEKTLFPNGLRAAWEIIRAINSYYDDQAPWSLAKAGQQGVVERVLYTGLETVRVLARLIAPIMPSTAEEIARQLGLPASGRWQDALQVNWLPAGHRVGEPKPIFPRKDEKKAKGDREKGKGESPKSEVEAKQGGSPMADYITMEEFKRVQIRVARVIGAELVPGTSKLLRLRVTLGDEERTIVAGIAETYAPESLVGKQIALLVNLQPATIRGVVSEGMLLAAEVEGKAVLLVPDWEVPDGSIVR